MRPSPLPQLERTRAVHPVLGGSPEGKMWGYFRFQFNGVEVAVVSSGGEFEGEEPTAGWEHVSVSGQRGRYMVMPTWNLMCAVKELFWTEDETVLQFHPRRSEYVNTHPGCLHLWKQCGMDHPLPPTILLR